MMGNANVVCIVAVGLALGLAGCGSQNVGGSGGATTGGSGGVAKGSGGTTSGVSGTGGKSEHGGSTGSSVALGSGGAAGSGTTGSGTGTGGGTGGQSNSGGSTGGAGTSGRGGAPATGGGTASGAADAGPAADAADAPVNPSSDASVVSDSPLPRGDTADAGTATSTCTGTSTLKAGENKATLQFGGRTRSYYVYVPTSVKAGVAVPLLFHFHGHGANAAQEASSSGWKKKADQAGFVMVYPEGVDSSWNVGSCCGLAMSENVDDVGFTKAIISTVSKAGCIDAKRIFAAGMSNGAGFVHRLGCEAADVIAAIAPASADLVTDPCTPVRPISVLAVRGLTDTMVAYTGGKTGSTGWYDPGAKASLELWKKIDQCTGSPATTLQYCESYTQCGGGVENTLCSLPNTGHDTYNNAVKMSVPDVAWEMFQRQPMP